MTQDEIDTMWQQAMRQSVEDGETYIRYHFAKLVAAKAIAELESQEPVGYAVPSFDFDNSIIYKVHYARTVPLYTHPPQAKP